MGDQEVPLTVEADSGFPWWLLVFVGIAIFLLVLWRRDEDEEEEEEQEEAAEGRKEADDIGDKEESER
ncbi:MAG: hypothetical protein ABEI52_10345 [Halobacteriaceae archaeon]